jgi:DNA mismatch endonuclease (patch repair protein)
MADVVEPAVRSRMMAGIRAINTKPELAIRQGLFKRGFRYVLHDRRLPGKPDLVLPRRRAVVFVNGCFWHCHSCKLFKWPSSNVDFWKRKLAGNRRLDIRNLAKLKDAGWRILVIWECALKGPSKIELVKVLNLAAGWLRGNRQFLEIAGRVP